MHRTSCYTTWIFFSHTFGNDFFHLPLSLSISLFLHLPSAAVKEAAGQRRHNLYRDSMVLTNSDPNLHLLGEQPGVDWAAQLGVEGHDLEGSLVLEVGAHVAGVGPVRMPSAGVPAWPHTHTHTPSLYQTPSCFILIPDRKSTRLNSSH